MLGTEAPQRAGDRRRRRRRVIDTSVVFHGAVTRYWRDEESRHAALTRRVLTRFERNEAALLLHNEQRGDELVKRVKDTFHHGLGIVWGDDQIRVFNAFLASCLPFIYGNTWAEEKARVLKEWKLQRENMFTLVNMARRNGKTFVTSGTTAALLLCVPHIKIAIFSTCKRTSQMMMSATLEMLERAFERGTHVTRQDFTIVQKNMESVCYEGPDHSKRMLGSFPGSVRVRVSRGARNTHTKCARSLSLSR